MRALHYSPCVFIYLLVLFLFRFKVLSSVDNVESVWTGTDPSDWNAQDVFDSQDVVFAVFWEVVKTSAIGNILLPAGHDFVLDLDVFQLL